MNKPGLLAGIGALAMREGSLSLLEEWLEEEWLFELEALEELEDDSKTELIIRN